MDGLVPNIEAVYSSLFDKQNYSALRCLYLHNAKNGSWKINILLLQVFYPLQMEDQGSPRPQFIVKSYVNQSHLEKSWPDIFHLSRNLSRTE